MVKLSVEKMRTIMSRKHNIRNMSIIAHVDHGKSTLTDSLVVSAGIVSLEDAGNKKIMDNREDEIRRGVTIKSTGISLLHEIDEGRIPPAHSQGREFLVNLIDCPGHVDFSSEVTAALRVSDGALVVVDCVEGCCVQTETVLRQAFAERIVPVLAINKLDRAFLELQMEPEEMYQFFLRSIESVNAVISTFEDETLGDCCVFPEKGTVAFSAGLHGWGFTVQQFAKLYAKKFNVREDKLVEKLWGDWFFDPQNKKWQRNPKTKDGRTLKRGFCQFIIEPLQRLFNACMETNWEHLDDMCGKLKINLKSEERKLEGKKLLKAVMQKWLPAADAILDMVIYKLPSPAIAQKYRVEMLYQGPLDDDTATAIRNCDENGPLVMFISKNVPDKNNSRFFSFGRVFSGTIKQGEKVRILGPNYEHGGTKDLFVDVSIQRTVLMMANKVEPMESVPCGNTVALMGVDTYMTKSATITNNPNSHALKNMKYSVSPVVRVAVQPKNPQEFPKLVEGMKKLAKNDLLVQCMMEEETGELIVAGAGELHLEICLEDLKRYSGIEIKVSDPVIPYQETILEQSKLCLAKSPNRHNRLYVEASPLSNELIEDIEKGKISGSQEFSTRSKILTKEHLWDIQESKKIWCFGPDDNGTNLLVDATKGVQYLNEIKDHMKAGFQWATSKGVLMNETLRGTKFKIMDVVLHPDAIHRGGGAIIPTARRVFYACELTGRPAIMEPIFQVDVLCPSKVIGNVHSVLSKRRGELIEEVTQGGGMVVVKAYLPVMESFGFTAALRQSTSGQAFPQCVFHHWDTYSSDPLEPESKANQIVQKVRIRKGMSPQIPPLDHFLDKL